MKNDSDVVGSGEMYYDNLVSHHVVFLFFSPGFLNLFVFLHDPMSNLAMLFIYLLDQHQNNMKVVVNLLLWVPLIPRIGIVK